MARLTIEKHWDSNVCESTGGNGRIYSRPVGWQFVLCVDDVPYNAYDRLVEAKADAARVVGHELRWHRRRDIKTGTNVEVTCG